MTTFKDKSLKDCRELYNKLATKASLLSNALEDLKNTSIYLNKTEAFDKAASYCFYNANYTNFENYDGDFDEFKSEGSYFEDDFKSYFGEAKLIDNVECVEVFPFFTDKETSFLNALNMGYFTGYSELSEMEALTKAKPFYAISDSIAIELVPEELEALKEWYASKICTTLSAFRKAETALTYIEKGFVHVNDPSSTISIRNEAGNMDMSYIIAKIEVAKACLITGWTVPPATCFGTDADKVNPVRRVPENIEELVS